MRLDQNPFFRKIIVPWYDSDTFCYIVMAVMAGVILFSWVGVGVARRNGEYSANIWVPLLLIFLSAAVILSTLVRLIKRHLHRYDK